jgi:hypothetical protein
MTNATPTPLSNMTPACRPAYRRFLRAQRNYRQARDQAAVLAAQAANSGAYFSAIDDRNAKWERLNEEYEDLLQRLQDNGIANPRTYLQGQPEIQEDYNLPVPPAPVPPPAAPAPTPAPAPTNDGGVPPADDAVSDGGTSGVEHIPAHHCGSICKTKDSLCARLTTGWACYQHVG